MITLTYYLLVKENEVEITNEGIEMRGLRRSIARVAYQLEVYLHNSRFEQ